MERKEQESITSKQKQFIYGFIIVVICLIIGISIGLNTMNKADSNFNYNNSNSDNNYYDNSSSVESPKEQAKKKFIKVLEEYGYVKDSPTKYIKQDYDDSCNATEEIYFNSSMYSNKILCKNDDGSYLENSADYYWNREVITGSSEVYYYYNNHRTLISSLTYSLDAYNTFSCSGNSSECEYVKATLPLFKSNFTHLINEAGITPSDLS